MFSPENMHLSNIIWTELIIFRKIYAYTYIHAITSSGNRGHEFEGEWRGMREVLERGKRREKCCN